MLPDRQAPKLFASSAFIFHRTEIVKQRLNPDSVSTRHDEEHKKEQFPIQHTATQRFGAFLSSQYGIQTIQKTENAFLP